MNQPNHFNINHNNPIQDTSFITSASRTLIPPRTFTNILSKNEGFTDPLPQIINARTSLGKYGEFTSEVPITAGRPHETAITESYRNGFILPNGIKKTENSVRIPGDFNIFGEEPISTPSIGLGYRFW